MLGSRIIKGKRVKIRPIFAFKPNTPILQHSYTLYVDIPQIATDIPIASSRDYTPSGLLMPSLSLTLNVEP
jgi:hypothetical protein